MAKKFPKLSLVLKKLLFQKGMKPIDLARELDIPQPTIHRIVTGQSTRPYRSSLEPIAEYFSLNIDQLIGEEPLPAAFVGEREDTERSLVAREVKYVSLISWEKLFTQATLQENSDVEKIPFLGNISKEGFATIMPDSSMEPVFPSNSILIFDPTKTPKDRSFVLCQLNDAELPVFRQLLIDLDHKYLKPLNPDLNAFKMRLLDENDKIYAVLVEARRTYDEH